MHRCIPYIAALPALLFCLGVNAQTAGQRDSVYAIHLDSRASGIDGDKANDHSNPFGLSADGRYVVFHSMATNLHPGISGDAPQVYVRDRQTHLTILVSRADGPDGVPANGFTGAREPAISADGRYVAFNSSATNLIEGATGMSEQMYIRDLHLQTTVLVSRGPAPDGEIGNAGTAFPPAFSADGRYLVFLSTAGNIHPDVTTIDVSHLYRRDLQTHELTLISRATGADGVPGNGQSSHPAVSADGRYVVFFSMANNLHPDDPDGDVHNWDSGDIYLRDLETNETLLLSRGPGADGEKGNAVSTHPTITADGRHVVFGSEANNLLPEADVPWRTQLYLRDLNTHELTLISRTDGPEGELGDDHSTHPVISADGRKVAFLAFATNLHPEATDGWLRPYLRDLHTGTTRLLSKTPGAGGVVANRDSVHVALSADGRHASFDSSATNLHPDDDDTRMDVYTVLISPPDSLFTNRFEDTPGPVAEQ